MNAPDPTADLVHAIASMRRRELATARTLKAFESGRTVLLYLHSVAALTIGPLFAVYVAAPGVLDGPTWAIVRRIPDAPHLLAGILFVGGALIMFGAASRQLHVAEMGLLLVFGWLVLIAVSFAAAIVVWLRAGHPATLPGLYAPILYLWLAAIIAIHVRTIRRSVAAGPPT